MLIDGNYFKITNIYNGRIIYSGIRVTFKTASKNYARQTFAVLLELLKYPQLILNTNINKII